MLKSRLQDNKKGCIFLERNLLVFRDFSKSDLGDRRISKKGIREWGLGTGKNLYYISDNVYVTVLIYDI
jgi:hypothetical protein